MPVPFVGPLRRLNRFFNHLLWVARPTLWIARGAERTGGKPLVVAYAGSSEPYKNYLLRTALAEGYAEESRRVFFWSAPAAARRAGAHLLVHEAMPARSRFFRFSGKARVPILIAMEIGLGDPDAVFSRHKVAGIARKAQKLKLSAESTVDEGELRRFYERMYEPYARLRFDDTAILLDWEKIKSDFYGRKSELLIVKKDGVPVGGAVLEIEPDRLRGVHVGVLDGREDLMREGIIAALYYFEMKLAVEKGLPVYDLGYSKAFLSNGSLRHKIYLGAKLVPRHLPGSGFFYLDVIGDGEGLRDFFHGNPFVEIDADGRYSVRAFVRNEPDPALISEWESGRGALDLRISPYSELIARP